jgi:hypothetical protein
MTNPDHTAIVLIVDRSGSMYSVKGDAEGAVNAFVADQAKVPGTCTVRLEEFNTLRRTVFAATPAAEAPTYVLNPGGGTALYDAVGQTVTEVGEELAELPEDQRPAKVVVVIQTDGQENSSREWTADGIKDLLTRQREQWAWQFVFLGADQDAFEAAGAMGVPTASTMSYAGTGVGTHSTYAAASAAVTRARTTGQSVSFTDDEREKAANGG